MGNAGCSSKPIQDPPKFDPAPPVVIKTPSASMPKQELSNPGTMEELNKKTKGNVVHSRSTSLN